MIKPLWAVAGVALLGPAGVAGVLVVASSGGEEEVVQQVETASPTPGATTTPTPASTPSLTSSPQPTSPDGTPIPIPSDWQTYEDPKGRFSIRVPPDWEYTSFSTEDNPVWLQAGESQKRNGHLLDGVRLEVGVQGKQQGETMDSLITESPELPTVSREQVTINGRNALKVLRHSDPTNTSQVVYVFERGDDWLLVLVWAAGPRSQEYVSTFEDFIIRAFRVL